MSSTRLEIKVKSIFNSAGISEREAFLRLVLSEGLSTGTLEKSKCSEKLELQQIFNSIADGIQLRFIRSGKSNLREEVFAKAQYSTSFTPFVDSQKSTQNPFAQIFLCPEKFENYKADLKLKQILKASAEALSEKEVYQMASLAADQALAKKKVQDFGNFKEVTNFFYPQSPIFGHLRPNWTKTYTLVKSVSENCVMFYKP